MSEAKLSKTVCGIINTLGGHVSRVEAAASAAGIPDLDYCLTGKESHIELKYGHSQKMPELRPSQVRWFRDRVKAGGRPFILCLDGDTDFVYLVRGIDACELKGKQPISKWRDTSILEWQMGDDLLVGLRNFLSLGNNRSLF